MQQIFDILEYYTKTINLKNVHNYEFAGIRKNILQKVVIIWTDKKNIKGN